MNVLFSIGDTAQSLDVVLADDTGLPLTGLTAATFPPVKLSRAGAFADVALTLSDLAGVAAAWAAGGVAERGEGVYRLDLPDAVFTASALWTVRGEAAGRHLIAPTVQVGRVPTPADVWANPDRSLTTEIPVVISQAELIAALEAIIVATGLTERFSLPDGTPVTTLNLRQAVAVILAATVGDRTGVGTAEIVAALPGAEARLTATRVSRTLIESTGVVPE